MAIELISKIKPKNDGSFSMVDAEDVEVDASGKRLNQVLAVNINNNSFVSIKLLTQAQYDELIEEGELIISETDPVSGESVRRTIVFDPNDVYVIYEDDGASSNIEMGNET